MNKPVEPTVQLRLDRSKTHATVHGERGPGDPHKDVHFYQDGLPFSARGFCVVDCITDDADKKTYERKIARLRRLANASAEEIAAEAALETAAANEEDDGDLSADDVNLESWLKGDANYPWFAVTGAIFKHHHRRISKTIDAVEFLINEIKVIPQAQLAEKYAVMLKASS